MARSACQTEFAFKGFACHCCSHSVLLVLGYAVLLRHCVKQCRISQIMHHSHLFPETFLNKVLFRE